MARRRGGDPHEQPVQLSADSVAAVRVDGLGGSETTALISRVPNRHNYAEATLSSSLKFWRGPSKKWVQ
jgi:hypothetical protein